MIGNIIRIALVATIGWPAFAHASVSADVLRQTRGGEDPDWPCIQRKVPELSVAGVWQGPPADDAMRRWRDDPEVAALAAELASRRVPIEEAREKIEAFATALGPAHKAERLTLLFAGLFQMLDRERGDIIEGIGRYARRQIATADEIRARQSEISDLSASDPQRAAAMTEDLIVETRIFNERRQSLAFVCESPIIVEQRLFDLSRAIHTQLPQPAP